MAHTLSQEKEAAPGLPRPPVGSVAHAGQEGRFKPPRHQPCGRRDGQAGSVGCSPSLGAEKRPGKAFSPRAGCSKGWSAYKLPLGLSFWCKSKAN